MLKLYTVVPLTVGLSQGGSSTSEGSGKTYGCMGNTYKLQTDKPKKNINYSQLFISQTLISQSMPLYKRMLIEHVSYLSLHFNFCLLKLLISQSKFFGPRYRDISCLRICRN